MSLGERIKLKRKQLNLTQKQLAEKLEMNNTTISKWESNIYEPDALSLYKLAELLDVSTDYLLGSTGRLSPTAEDDNFKVLIHDPEHVKFVKDYLAAPDDHKQELRRYWKLMQDAEKGQKLGEQQAESDSNTK